MNALVTHQGPRNNARTWGNRFVSRFLEPGVISYKDVGGDVELLSFETIQQFAHTFVGRPLIVQHSKVTPQTMESKAAGYITKVWFEPADGWFYCEGIVINDDAKDLIEKGWRVSCSYHVTATAEQPGSYHCIPYAREITAFDGEHLAIVKNPRYEGATIRLNSKPIKENNVKNLFKMFRKNAAPAPAAPAPEPKKDEEKRENALPADTLIEVSEGKNATLGELIERFNAKAPESEDISPESTIEVGEGKTVTLGELVTKWNEANKPFVHENVKRNENESDEDYKSRCHAYDEEQRKNAEAEEEKKKHDNAKKTEEIGKQAFRVLSNARKAAPVASTISQPVDGFALGKSRYGSGKN